MAELDLPDPEIRSRFEIEGILGRGGFGTVYLARSKGGIPLAVKVLRAEARDEDSLRRFAREARIGRALDHPHILKVLEAGSLPSGAAYLCFPYLDGSTLEARIQAEGPSSQKAVLAWAEPLFEALELAHRQKIVHRDLKPSNILFDSDGVAYLVDFGVARSLAAGTKVTEEGVLLGTPAYLAPEIWKGEPPGPRSDQWALAAILFEALVGRALLPEANFHTCLRLIPKGQYRVTPRLDGSRLEAHVPLERALSLEAQDRYPSLLEFRDGFRDPPQRSRPKTSSGSLSHLSPEDSGRLPTQVLPSQVPGPQEGSSSRTSAPPKAEAWQGFRTRVLQVLPSFFLAMVLGWFLLPPSTSPPPPEATSPPEPPPPPPSPSSKAELEALKVQEQRQLGYRTPEPEHPPETLKIQFGDPKDRTLLAERAWAPPREQLEREWKDYLLAWSRWLKRLRGDAPTRPTRLLPEDAEAMTNMGVRTLLGRIDSVLEGSYRHRIELGANPYPAREMVRPAQDLVRPLERLPQEPVAQILARALKDRYFLLSGESDHLSEQIRDSLMTWSSLLSKLTGEDRDLALWQSTRVLIYAGILKPNENLCRDSTQTFLDRFEPLLVRNPETLADVIHAGVYAMTRLQTCRSCSVQDTSTRYGQDPEKVSQDLKRTYLQSLSVLDKARRTFPEMSRRFLLYLEEMLSTPGLSRFSPFTEMEFALLGLVKQKLKSYPKTERGGNLSFLPLASEEGIAPLREEP